MRQKLRYLCTLLLLVVAGVAWGDEVIFTAGTDKGPTTVQKNGITVNMSTMNRDDNYRCYANSDLKVYGNEGISVTKIEIICTAKGNADYGPGKFSLKEGAPGSYTYESNGDKGTWTGNATKDNPVLLTASTQVRMTKIVVTYEVATSDYTITAQSNNTDYGTVSLSGNVITGTPNNGYRYASPAYTIDPANSATVAQDGNAFTVTPSANTTVTINFEAIPTYTVTLGDDNSTLTQTIGGAGVTLPAREALNGYDFAGWSITNVSEETTTAPTIIPAGSYAPTANITLYPVYTKTGGGTTPSAFSVGNTGNYAIVSAEQSGKYFALPTNPTVSSGKITAQEITVSVSNDVKYITTANAEGFTWTIASATNGYTLSDGSNYIYHSNGGASGTNLAYGVNTSYTWAFTADGDYVTMAGMNGSTINNRGLLFSGTTIGGYALSNANSSGYYKVMILPISAGSTTYYWSSPKAAVVEIPTIVIAENPFLFSTTATITCATNGATIMYSFDGENWSEYSSSLTITETKTIYAKAINGENESATAQLTATKNLAMPTVTVSGALTLDLDGKTNVNAGTLTAAVTYNNAAVEGAAVTWSSSNTNVATIDASTGAVTLLTIGDVTFTATYAGNSDYAESTGTKAVTVIDNKAPGTENNPYTVTQARAAIDASTGTQGVYATGIVCKASTSLYSNKYLSYYISDDGKTDSPQLEAYNGLGKDGANFTSADDIQVGDEVVIYGNLMKYNSTYEFAANNKLISLVRNTLSAPTFSVAAGTYKEAQSVEITCATEDATIHYSFDNENWTLYENPIIISESKTLYAKAMKGDKEETASAQYVILIDTAIEGYKYVKVTSTEDITDGQYLIVYEDGTNSVAFDGGLETLDAVSNTVSVTISNNEIAASTFMQAAEFTIDVTNGTLKSTSGYYIGVSSNENKLNQTDEALIYKNTFSLDESGAVISAVFDESTMTLRFNKASNQARFRYYKSGQEAIQLYKLVEIVPPAAPTFSPVAGEVEKGTVVTISAEEGTTLKYTVGEVAMTSESNTATVAINEDVTIKAVAVKDGVESEEVSAAYTVKAEEPVVEPGTPAAITAGFYTIKNLGNQQFVNVAGRKTVTFVGETATAPGTVIKVESNEQGQVQVLRSQGVDLPGYAERAMKYVPKIVQLVAEKLGAEGEGNLLGKDGLGKIMDKFNESFDYHLYTEQGEQGVRIYGKTPSMQPVVDFYNDNKANVDAKLPMLEDFINSAIRKVLDKTSGSGASILTEFSLHEIWEKMGKTLTEPVDADSKLAFLQDVLSNKQYVWDFAYQTAMKYWKPLINHKMVQQKLSELGDLAQYVEKIEYIRPDVKYYIVQKNGKIDFISQDNTLLKETSSEWELTERKTFTVNFDEKNVQKEKYYTTLYTDFAYKLPEGVKAMTVAKVAELNGKNIAITETIKGAVPAQTPVLLESATAGNVELTLDVTDGTAIENLLKGNDWLVNELEITTPQVDKLFGIVHDLLVYENMESLYDRYVKEYEYLKKRNAGTVNNKYFFGLSGDDIAEATTNICQFTKDELGLAFSHNLVQSAANKAFLPGDKDPVYLSFVGDVDRDGDVDKDDLSALIKIILGTDTKEDNYDYDAANVNEDENENPDIADVTALVNILK